MKNILLPTDFSPASKNAIQYALRLFHGTTCTFHLLSVYKAWKYTSGDLMKASADDSIYDILISESKSKLEQLIAKMENSCAGEDYTYKAISDYDVFTDSINKLIEAEYIDLIIMGTDGASGTQEKLFGSHTLRVIRNVNSPLLVIPVQAKFHTLRRILLSLDYSIDLKNTTIQPLLDLIGNHSFSLEILNNVDPEESEDEVRQKELDLKQAFEIYNPTFHKVSDVPFPEAISTFVQSMEIDMNILPVKKEEFLERIFGSQLAKIIYATEIPLFILHAPEDLNDEQENLPS